MVDNGENEGRGREQTGRREMASDTLTFASFEKFKSEVALRTKRALMGQQTDGAGHGRDAGRSSDRTGRGKSSERPRSARGREAEENEHVPIHERIPARMKHTPRHLEPAEEPRGRTPSDKISKRLLNLASTEKPRAVTLWANTGNYSAPGVRCLVPDTFEQLLDLAATKVNLPSAARLIFRLPAGQPISSLAQIEDEDCLVFSTKEAFRPPSPKKKARPTTAIPVRDTKAAKRRYALHHKDAMSGSSFADGSELKHLLTDTSRLLRRFRLSYGGIDANAELEGRQERTLEDVRLLCGLGAVSLRNQALTSVKGMPVVEDMAELYLQNNLLSELTDLTPQPKLRELRLELNNLTSLKGWVHHPRLDQVYLYMYTCLIYLKRRNWVHHPRLQQVGLAGFGFCLLVCLGFRV